MYWTSSRRKSARELLGVAALLLEQARERLRLLAQLALEVRGHAQRPRRPPRAEARLPPCAATYPRARVGRQTGRPISTTIAPSTSAAARIQAWRCASRTTYTSAGGIGSPSRTTAPSECSASPAAMFATGRSSTMSGVAAERDVALDAHRAARGVGGDGAVRRLRARVRPRREPSRRVPAASRRRPSSTRRGERGDESLDVVLAEVVADDQRVARRPRARAPPASSTPTSALTPFISSASAITRPSKPSSLAEQAVDDRAGRASPGASSARGCARS